MSALGRWVIEKARVYSPYSGVTSNQSESFNAVLKRLQLWKEVPVDVIVLSLFYLQAYYHNEIQRGFCGLGNYSLAPEFAPAHRSEDEINIISTYSPNDIVSKMRERVSGCEAAAAEVSSPTEEASEAASLLNTQHSRARLVSDRTCITTH